MTEIKESIGRTDRRRLLHTDGWVIAVSMLVTTGIIVWLNSVRAEVATPESVRIFLSLILFQDLPAAVLMLALLPLGLMSVLREIGLKLVSWCGQHPWTLFATTVLALAVGVQVVYHAHPLAMDEYAAVFQSRVFAAGQLHGQLPPVLVDLLVPPGFQGHFLGVSHETGRVASMYWPGFALLMTPFAWLGLGWLTNPVLGGLAVFLVHRVTLQLTESIDAAGFAALLTIASPAVSVNAISFYSMTGHLVCNLAFVLLLLRPTVLRSVAAGFVGSVALVLHNPVPHMLVALPWLLWLSGQKNAFRLLAGAALGYAPLCILAGLGWWHVLAELTVVGASTAPQVNGGDWMTVWTARLGAIDVFRVPALNTLEDRLMALAKMWIWAVPGMLVVSLLGLRRSGHDVRVRLLAWSAVATLVGFLFVPVDQGHGWGFDTFTPLGSRCRYSQRSQYGRHVRARVTRPTARSGWPEPWPRVRCLAL